MSMQDLVSDFTARINNALMVGNTSVTVLKSGLIISICKKMATLRYFDGFEVDDRSINIELNLTKLHRLTRVSRPGQRIFASYKMLPRVVGGIGHNILTTSQGIMTGIECKKNMVGGEVLFQVV